MTSETPISPVTTTKPELTISAPAMNEEPIELDGTPTSPETVRAGQGRRGSKAEVLAELSPEEREKRQKLISDRQNDPAVLVDLPQTPNSDEFGKSKDAEATVSEKATSGSKSS